MDDKKIQLSHEMETYYDPDKKRIDHTYQVVGYAEELLKLEGGDAEIVIAAAFLHDVGIPVAKEKYGSSAPLYQEREGPPVARKILSGLEYRTEQIDEVCEIIAHHHTAGIVNTLNFKVLYDADWLVNLKDHYDTDDKEKLFDIIDKVFLTLGGKSIAKKIYMSGIQ